MIVFLWEMPMDKLYVRASTTLTQGHTYKKTSCDIICCNAC